jgi:hypothetical protein
MLTCQITSVLEDDWGKAGAVVPNEIWWQNKLFAVEDRMCEILTASKGVSILCSPDFFITRRFKKVLWQPY